MNEERVDDIVFSYVLCVHHRTVDLVSHADALVSLKLLLTMMNCLIAFPLISS